MDRSSSFNYVAVDTEGFTSDTILGISIANPALESMYFPYGHKEDVNVDDEVRQSISDVLKNIPYRIFHNASYDLTILPDLFDLPFIDTMIMGHMVDENLFSKGLDYMHKVHCGGEGKVKDELIESIKKTMGWEWIPFELMNKYATEDALITMELFITLKEKYEAEFGAIWS